jgi:PQQ-like domain
MKCRTLGVTAAATLALASSALLAQAAVPTAGAPPKAVAATPITPNGSWPTYHHDDAHTGFDGTQPSTATASAGWTSQTLDESVYGEPLVYQGIVYVATLNNTVYALNQTDGTVVWSTNLRAPETGGWQCGNVSPQGILGTPVIDPATGRIYAATLGSDDVYRLEGLNLATGAEELDTVITTPAAGFDWTIEQERGALAVRNGFVYVPFGGRAGDCGNYHGYVFAVPTNGTPVTHYYQTPGAGAGFWNAGGMVVDDSTGNVFNTSGNGVSNGCDANSNGTPVFENDAVVEFSSTLTHLGAFIPQDWQANWCGNDQDLGSASMVLISPTLAFQAGKWGNGFLVNPQALAGMDGQLYPSPKPAAYSSVDVCFGNNSDANFGSYSYSAPYVYLSCDGHGLVGLKVTTTTPVSFSACGSTCSSPTWKAGGTTSFGPPIVAGNAVWAISTGGGGLYGFDATTGAQIYHSGGFGATHFSTPSEAGGQIFVGADNVVMSFNMLGGCRSVSGSASPTSTASVGTTVTVTATASGCQNPLYQFWLLAPGAGAYQMVQAYSATRTFAWNTTGLAPGSYRFSIWVRDTSSSGIYGNQFGRWDAYDNSVVETLVVPACTGPLSVMASPASPAGVGTGVTITARATGCPDPNPLYQFWYLAPGASAYHMAQAYSSSNTFSWSTAGIAPGTYHFSIWARDASSTGAFGNQFGRWDTYNNGLTYALSTCSSLSVRVSPASPAAAGTTVTVTAQASGCPNPSPLYQFWILAPGGTSYQVAQAYSTNGTFTWSTGGLATGTYRFSVWVRDANSGGVQGNQFGTWDAYNNNTTYLLS